MHVFSWPVKQAKAAIKLTTFWCMLNISTFKQKGYKRPRVIMLADQVADKDFVNLYRKEPAREYRTTNQIRDIIIPVDSFLFVEFHNELIKM